ncbi:MAG: hypothetical protein IKC41_00870 [Clostridia bacterium]|nr:hypothetical protein [Clostridia bacterium]
MKHSVIFKNTDNHWDNALPLGNGVLGAMLYFEKGTLNMPLNHYEIYYNIGKNVLPEDILAAMPEEKNPGRKLAEITARADANLPIGNEPYVKHGSRKEDVFKEGRFGRDKAARSYPKTGNFKFNFDIENAKHTLALYVEDAVSRLTLENDSKKVCVDTIIARRDCVINRISQSGAGLVPSFEVEIPYRRDELHPEVSFTQPDKSTFVYTCHHLLPDVDSTAYTNAKADENAKTFVFSGVIRLIGAEGHLIQKDSACEIAIENADAEFTVMTGIFTDWNYKNPASDGISVMDKYNLDELYSEHKSYWDEFFAKCVISVPDKFIEHVYYVNQYALDCCSGEGGIMKHHACGLNGLWDVKSPNLWGSKWYWDVNIQAAFAGVFSSNRLHLAKVFSDGLLSYINLSRHHAKDVHNSPGISGDYPHHIYYSCWPWCAQYLWFLYEYTLDKEYLEKDAFPLFAELCKFFCDKFKYNEKLGYYSIYPDYSPEQGPTCHDSIITVSCVKYLFKFTLEAAQILGKDFECADKCREIMNNMAPYPVSGDGMYGVHLIDSPDAPDNMWIRHPSMLMPLFPIDEIDPYTDEKMKQIFSNTVDYLEDRTEIGIFGGSWISAAAARLGRGQTALRMLYERGIDHMLRSNGLTAEATDRFMNYCLIFRQPLYYPCMMEFTGEMLAAFNEMLLQSHGGIIRVFPALPDGDPELERMLRHGYAFGEYQDRFAKYDAWNTVRFDKMLCKGAFEISASLTDRKLDFIEITSKKDNRAVVASPFMTDDLKVFCSGKAVDFAYENGVISFDTESGKTYIIAGKANVCTAKPEENYSEDVLSHLAYTKRNIYLGEDAEARYRKSVDAFMRDWYLANIRMANRTVYKFDFTNEDGKHYAECFPRQTFAAEEICEDNMSFFCIGNENAVFTAVQGYGFTDASALQFETTNAPDPLRRDFVCGRGNAEFIIEAPRGQYEILVVSGDDSTISLDAEGGRRVKKYIAKGEYEGILLPLVKEDDDEPIRLKISGEWKIQYMMLNAIK